MTFTLAGLNLYHSIASLVFHYVNFFGCKLSSCFTFVANGKEYYLVVHRVHIHIVWPIIDLLTVMGLLYLFYELERRMQIYRKRPVKGARGLSQKESHETRKIRDILRNSDHHGDDVSENKFDSHTLKSFQYDYVMMDEKRGLSSQMSSNISGRAPETPTLARNYQNARPRHHLQEESDSDQIGLIMETSSFKERRSNSINAENLFSKQKQTEIRR